MRKVYRLNTSDISQLIKDVKGEKERLQKATERLAKRLAEIGLINATIQFASAPYDGVNDTTVTVEQRSPTRYAVVANGRAALFIEFGAGHLLGYGHPEASANGMGPGTWPDPHYSINSAGETVQNWENDLGWYLPASLGGGKTYGTPPSMPMYNSAKDLHQRLEQIVREVFQR